MVGYFPEISQELPTPASCHILKSHTLGRLPSINIIHILDIFLVVRRLLFTMRSLRLFSLLHTQQWAHIQAPQSIYTQHTLFVARCNAGACNEGSRDREGSKKWICNWVMVTKGFTIYEMLLELTRCLNW